MRPFHLVNRMDSLRSSEGSAVSQDAAVIKVATSFTLRQPFAAAQIVHWEFSISIVSIQLSKASVGRPTLAKLALSWVHYVSLAMACARLPGSIQLVKTLDASLDGVKDWIAFGHYTQCPTLFRSPLATCPGTGECISPAAIFNEIAQGHGFNFRELMYCRIEMMTALCQALAHTYQTRCLGFSPEQLRPEAFRLPNIRPEAFRLPKAQEKVRTPAQLPNYYQTDW